MEQKAPFKTKKYVGYVSISDVCKDAGISRGVYYNAMKNLQQGKPLSPNQVNVLEKVDELVKEAKKKIRRLACMKD